MFQKQQGWFVALAIINLLCINLSSIQAQDQKETDFFRGASIVSRLHYGFLLAHHARVEHLVRHTFGFELSLSQQTLGKKAWQQHYQYPQTGFTYVFLDFNNPKIVGNAHAAMAFINIPLVRKENFQFSFRMASGLGYVTKKYERVENYKNDVIGSHLNAAIQLNFETRYTLSRQVYFNFNVGLTHFSNGSFRTPNLGINNPSVNSGFTYALHAPASFIRTERLPYDKKIQVDVLYAAGVKEMYPPTGKQYVAHTLSSTLMKPVGYKVRLGFGLDVFYDLGLLQDFREANKPVDTNFKIVRSGIHFDHELMIEKLSVLFQMGVYWLDQYKHDGSLYHRIGFKYLVSQHFFVNLTLKTHFAKADYTELGVGWKFYKVK